MKGIQTIALIWLTGCYTFEPVRSPAPGTDVRARLDVEAAIRRSAGLDDPIRNVDGRLIAAGPDSIEIDVLLARSTSVFLDITMRDTVVLGTDEVEEIQARRFAPLRTGLFVAGLGVGAVLAVKGISTVVGGSDEGDGDPPPRPLVVPVFSIVIGRGGVVFHPPGR